MSPSHDPLPTVWARELDPLPPEEQWLIEGLWSHLAVGIIGGAPKCCKTWFGLELAVSVASGTPALGRFRVHLPGPVLLYLAEDALPQVRSRIEALCHSRRLDIEALQIRVITAPALRLDRPDDQGRLAATLKDYRPRLLLLDPLVRLHGLDENSAADVSRLLGYFRELQRTFDVAVVLVHHASKKQRSQPGQALRGSSDLHAFGDSNAYLARRGEGIVLTLEHRAAKTPDPIPLKLVARDEGGVHFELPSRALDVKEPALEERLKDLLAASDRPLPRNVLRSRLRVNNQRLGDTLQELASRSAVHRTPSGWTLASRAHRKLPGETESGSAGVQPDKG